LIDLSSARLVTLSACETGISDVLQGSPEEFVGIPAGFLLAGVPCVVSSLWAVTEISTAMLMEQFYSNHLHQGMDIAKALNQAQQWLRTVSIETVIQYIERCNDEYRRGDTIKASLTRYQRYYRYRAQQNPKWQPFYHPYYWAAFTVNGC
jgi:CHAT domain-containing protein